LAQAQQRSQLPSQTKNRKATATGDQIIFHQCEYRTRLGCRMSPSPRRLKYCECQYHRFPPSKEWSLNPDGNLQFGLARDGRVLDQAGHGGFCHGQTEEAAGHTRPPTIPYAIDFQNHVTKTAFSPQRTITPRFRYCHHSTMLLLLMPCRDRHHIPPPKATRLPFIAKCP
jgi:hypothetical protein